MQAAGLGRDSRMHEEMLVAIAAAANKDMNTLETANSSVTWELAVQDRTMLSTGMVFTYYKILC